jgi:hypothetical protein
MLQSAAYDMVKQGDIQEGISAAFASERVNFSLQRLFFG